MKKVLLICCLVLFNSAIGQTIRVVSNQSMPFNGLTTATIEGKIVPQAEGMTFEILEAVTAAGGPEFLFDFGLPWNRAQHVISVSGTELVVIVPLTRTSDREDQYQWIAPLFQHRPRLSVYNKSEPVTLEEAAMLRVGVIKSSALIPLLESLNISNLLQNSEATLNARLLRFERIHAIAESQYVDTYHWKMAGFNPGDLLFTPLGEPQTIYVAANKAFPKDIANQISDLITRLKQDGTLEKILSKWEQ